MDLDHFAGKDFDHFRNFLEDPATFFLKRPCVLIRDDPNPWGAQASTDTKTASPLRKYVNF